MGVLIMKNMGHRKSAEIGLGEFFFKYRDYTPLPLILILFFIAQPGVFSSSLGFLFILLGEFLRLYSVSFIGPKSRTRGKGTGDHLIQEGPYSFSRNPLYLANFLIAFGFSCYSGKLWFVLFSSLLFFIQYHYIIIFEEVTLAKKFPKEYPSYCKKVSRLFPKSFSGFEDLEMPRNFFSSFKTERRTLTSIAVIWVFLMFFS